MTIGPGTDDSFEIHLAWSDKILVVSSDQSTLNLLIGADIPIEPGCTTGSCGECVTPYVEGDVVHMDSRALAQVSTPTGLQEVHQAPQALGGWHTRGSR